MSTMTSAMTPTPGGHTPEDTSLLDVLMSEVRELAGREPGVPPAEREELLTSLFGIDARLERVSLRTRTTSDSRFARHEIDDCSRQIRALQSRWSRPPELV